jgi:hypothetical protein
MQKSKSINHKINSNYFGYCNLMFITRQKLQGKQKLGWLKLQK